MGKNVPLMRKKGVVTHYTISIADEGDPTFSWTFRVDNQTPQPLTDVYLLSGTPEAVAIYAFDPITSSDYVADALRRLTKYVTLLRVYPLVTPIDEND